MDKKIHKKQNQFDVKENHLARKEKKRRIYEIEEALLEDDEEYFFYQQIKGKLKKL